MKRIKTAVLAALALAVCAAAASATPIVLKVGASPVPHAAILKSIVPVLKA